MVKRCRKLIYETSMKDPLLLLMCDKEVIEV